MYNVKAAQLPKHNEFVQVDGSGRHPLAPLYTGLFLVLEHNQSYYKLQNGTWQEVVDISRLKPAHTPANASPAQPPNRGHPRKHPPASPTPAKWNRGHSPATTKSGGIGRLHSAAPAPPVPVEQRTRSGRTFAILPLVSEWRGGLWTTTFDTFDPLCRLH